MDSKEELLKFVSSLPYAMVEYTDIEEWYSTLPGQGTHKDVLKSILATLVLEGNLQHRLVKSDDDQEMPCDLYWLCKSSKSISSATRSTCISKDKLSMKKRSRFSYPLTTKANKRIKYNSEVGTVDDGTASFRLTELIKEKKKLTTELSEKEDCLHKLQLVKLYRSKNNLDQLERLIEKWREASQEAAADLIGMTTADPPPTMAEMLNYLHINPLDIHYSVEDQEFY